MSQKNHNAPGVPWYADPATPRLVHFRCPRCGGKYFGTICRPKYDESFAPLTSRRDILAALANGHAVEADGRIIPGGHVSLIRPECTGGRVLASIEIAIYRCHNTSDGQDDVTDGAIAQIDYGTHAVFPGATGSPCGWEGMAADCLIEEERKN